jgi:hypothetical protein
MPKTIAAMGRRIWGCSHFFSISVEMSGEVVCEMSGVAFFDRQDSAAKKSLMIGLFRV